MKIRYLSDLHYGINRRDPHPIPPPTKDESGILLLAGDVIDNGRYGVEEVKQACKDFDRVIMVPGNHEYYNMNLKTGVDDIKSEFNKDDGYPTNLDFFDMGIVEFDKFAIIAATLWTDLNHNNPIETKIVRTRLNDFYQIQKNDTENKLITCQDMYDTHNKHLDYIRIMYTEMVEKGKKVVVMTHHGCSYQSVHPMFKGTTLNICFVSELDQFILDRPEITHWVHGHVHSRHEYKIGTTTVVTNPAGYKGERFMKNDELQYNPYACIEV